jgi:hypothetical protein
MADLNNIDPDEILIVPDHDDDKQIDTPPIDVVPKKTLIEKDVERGFKEGLANNSDTDKENTQQK